MGSFHSKAKVQANANGTTKNITKMTNNTENEKLPIQGPESIMSKKEHGTSKTPVQKNLRWGCDFDTADRICNFNVRIRVPFDFILLSTHIVGILLI